MNSAVPVFEDDADVHNLQVEALADAGDVFIRAVETVSGAQALVAECGNSFAADVLDVGLPVRDRREFCATLHRQGSLEIGQWNMVFRRC